MRRGQDAAALDENDCISDVSSSFLSRPSVSSSRGRKGSVAGSKTGGEDDDNDDDNNSLLNLVASFLGPPESSMSSETTKKNPAIIAGTEKARRREPNPGTLTVRTADSSHSRQSERHTGAGFFLCRVIVFSKDRPWQLQQLLRSMDLPSTEHDSHNGRRQRGEEEGQRKDHDFKSHQDDDHDHDHDTADTEIISDSSMPPTMLEIIVIVRASGSDFASGYERVRRQFHHTNCSFSKKDDINGSIPIRFVYERNSDTSVHTHGLEPRRLPVVGPRNEAFSYPLFAHLLEEAISSPPLHPFTNRGIQSSTRISLDEINKQRTSFHLLSPQEQGAMIMFLTDDCLLLVPLLSIIHTAHSCLFNTNNHTSSNNHHDESTVLSFISRLHPGITWCQTKGTACPPPSPQHLHYHLPPPPSFTAGSCVSYSSSHASESAYIFDQRKGTGDWSYPFDLSGGIYRQHDVRAILKYIRDHNICAEQMKSSEVVMATISHHIADTSNNNNDTPPTMSESHEGSSNTSICWGYSHPNCFEISGNIALAHAYKKAGEKVGRRRSNIFCVDKDTDTDKRVADEKELDLHYVAARSNKLAVPTRPFLLILAINHVQDVYHAPLAIPMSTHQHAAVGDNDEGKNVVSSEPHALLQSLNEHRHLDLDQYRAMHFNSSHIGTVLLLPEPVSDSSSNEPSIEASDIISSSRLLPALSVLIPVHTGPPTVAAHAMFSIMKQSIEERDARLEQSNHNKVDSCQGSGDLNMCTTGSVTMPKAAAFIGEPVYHSKGHSSSGPNSCGDTVVEPSSNLNYQSTLLLSPMQIVLVDDRCTDGSIDAMLTSAKELTNSQSAVSLSVSDFRGTTVGSMGGNVESNNNSKLMEEKGMDGEIVESIKTKTKERYSHDARERIDFIIDVHSSPRAGVSSALNYGLKHCRSDVIARMDADDVSCPDRLISQTRALRARPDLSVLGTSSVLFTQYQGGHNPTMGVTDAGCTEKTVRDGSCGASDATGTCCVLPYSENDRFVEEISIENAPTETQTTNRILRISLPPCDAGFTSWAMLFTCSVSHPSVMFRKSAVENVGGYDESICHAEDYDLWLRLTLENCRLVCSLPRIGLWHRKHHLNSSNETKALKQQDESLLLSLEAMKKLLGEEVTLDSGGTLHSAPPLLSKEVVLTLKKPDTALSESLIDDAAYLLVSMEQAFLHRHHEFLTEREIELIRQDCSARIGELATVSVTKFAGADSAWNKWDMTQSGAWKLWCKRCPGAQLERIALLYHHSTSNY